MAQSLPEPFRSDQRPVVIVFRAPVFNASETFVRAHALGLRRYQPLVVGSEAKGNIPPALDGRIIVGARAERLRPFAPALVHAHFATDGLRALGLAERLGVPLITSLRGYDVTRSRAGLLGSGRLSWMRYALFQDRLMRRGDLFLAVSEALRRQAVERGFPAERTFTHYNGVDLDRFRPGVGDGDTILHVARLVEKKGTEVLLRAFAVARAEHPRARLVIAGDGPLRRRLEALAGALGVADACLFVGALAQDEIAAWMTRAALLAAPSLTARDGDGEGLPNVVVEAMASGLPVVASDHGGIAEAVADGQNGLLVPEGEPEPLARGIGELLGNAGLRARMGAAGRTIAEEKFDVVRQMARLEARYDDLTRTRASATR